MSTALHHSKTGGPAFQTSTTTLGGHGQGMTLRDYFATRADCDANGEWSAEFAESVLKRSCPRYQDDPVGMLIFWADFRAKLRYIEADAMLRARLSA